MKDTRRRDIRSAVTGLGGKKIPDDPEEAREFVAEYVKKRASRLYSDYKTGRKSVRAYWEWKHLSEESSVQEILTIIGNQVERS